MRPSGTIRHVACWKDHHLVDVPSYRYTSSFVVSNQPSLTRRYKPTSRTFPGTPIWVCLKIVYPIVPNGFADHYPYEKLLFHWEYTQHFQTNPYNYGLWQI